MSWRLRSSHCVGYWPLDNHARDLSGNGNDGNWGGTEAYAERPNRKMCADFDGANTYIDFGSTPDLDFPVQDFTVSLWINSDGVSNGRRLYEKGTYNTDGIIIYHTATGITFDIHRSGARSSVASTALVAGVDYHICCIRKGSYMTIYLDGEFNNYRFDAIDGDSTSNGLWLGASNPSIAGDYDGKMWDVRVYDIALTGDEVKKLFLMDRRN